MRIRLLIILFILPLSLWSQRYGFLDWSTDEGLAQSQVRSIEQDHLGYLWIGTLGGVSRFNGTSFDNFSKQDGLHNNQVNSIYQLNNQSIALGAIGGLSIFDGHTFETILFPEAQRTAQVNHMYEDGENRLWVGTEKGLLCLKNGTWISLEHISDFPGNTHIKRIAPTSNGLLIACKEGICALREEDCSWELKDTQLGASIMDFYQSGSQWWIATIGKGLIIYDQKELQSFGPEEGLRSRNISGIESDGKGGAWLKSRDGLFHFDGKSMFSEYSDKEGLSTSDVRALCVDKQGILWLGTNGGGLQKFTGESFRYYTTEQGLSGNIVMSVVMEQDSTWWFSTYDNGITRKRGEEWTSFGLEEGLPNTRVWTSLIDSKKRIWFGTSGGLALWNGSGFETFDTSHGLPHKQVLSVFEGLEGHLYAGTAKGLCKFNEVTSQFESEGQIPAHKVRSIDAESNGDLWVGTNGGVYALSEAGVLHFSEEDGLPDNSVYTLVVDDVDRVWVGTESGLSVLQNEKIMNIPLPGGFGSNHINFIRFDRAGGIWMGSNNGLFYHPNPGELLAGKSGLRRFGYHDGLTLLETNQNAAWMQDDHFWMGTSMALVEINTDALLSRSTLSSPPIVLSDVLINLEAPIWDKYKAVFNGYGSWPNEFEVPYTDNHFTFYFDSPDLNHPEGIQYEFNLNEDDKWQSSGELAVTSFSSLSFDDYTFRVRAKNALGEVGESTSISFVILPPFWLTWWFILIEVVAVGALVFLIVRWRRNVLVSRLEKERLEYRSRMLALEQQTLNSSLNRHFIFNALNSIQYYINRKDRLSANKYLSSFAKLIRKNLDSSETNLTSLQEEIDRLNLYLELEHMRFQGKFEYAIEVDEDVDTESIQVPSMLLQPFLENSIWHGILPKNAPGKVTVRISRENGHEVMFTITDDGIGIDTSMANKDLEQDHISKGMRITGSRIELIQKMTGQHVQLLGPYELKGAGQEVLGTEVKIILPLSFEGFFAN
jgi:ligand-binding sensor domain-containing protein